ncbi:MAG: LPXTG cell wall anchor domain-containing protein [Burkholderiaceae bacterium]|nr:LPXTG cell wall anchor domain-containing protein [Burkholderiaceae bacterium]
MKHFLTAIFMASIALPAWAGGDSSDGHTHAAPEPVLAVATSPRATATSEDFEIVIALEDNRLVLYVDRFASNEPVTKARIEVEGAGLKGLASEVAPGTYVIDSANPLPAAKHALTISIEAGDTADLLLATLDTSPAAAAEAHIHSWNVWAVWIVAAMLLLAGIGLLLARRKRRNGVSS